MDKKFIDKIEELRHHTYSRINQIQKNLCPMVKDVYMHYQFEYWFDGYKYNLWENDKHLYAVKEIPYCYDNDIKNTVFMDTLDNLVNDGKVWPFLLFINGDAIQWSKITIIHDYDYSYMTVSGYVPDESFYAKMVVFPISSKYLRYGEDNNILITSDRKGLYFKDGKRLESTDLEEKIDIRLEILDNYIYFKIVNLDTVGDSLTFKDLPDGFVPTLNNIITFNDDGTYNNMGPDVKISNLYNGTFGLFKVLNIENGVKWAVLMYNTKGCKEKTHIYDRIKDINKNNIIDFLKAHQNISSDIFTNVIKPLIEPFDFDFDYKKDYNTNLSEAAKYISRYDFHIWRDAFVKDLNIKSKCYTGAEFKSIADDKGYIHLSRKNKDIIEEVAIVFVNHRLYQYMIDVTYVNNTINIPIFGIIDDDYVEIITFSQCNNNILDISINDENSLVYINPAYNLDDCYIMSESCPDAVYEVPDNPEGRKQYKVDFNYIKEGNEYKIIFDNPFYYGKKLKIVPKRQYRYYRYKQKDDQKKVILPTQFNYCHDFDRYMVFINGKKIDKSEYTITFMNKWRPFDKLVLYISTILDKGDYIDILYIPELLVEKYKQDTMPKNGYLVLDDTDTSINYPTTYPLSKDTVMLFVNGLKVNPLDIKDVSLNSVLVNVDEYKRNEDGSITIDEEVSEKIKNRHQVNSIYNISIVEFVPGNKEISGYLEGLYEQIPAENPYNPDDIDFNKPASDAWKDLIRIIADGSIPGVDLTTIFGNIFPIENPEDDYKKNYSDLRSILYDAVIDYYLTANEATTGSEFVYDFHPEEFENQEGSDKKIINLFPDKDKLFDYDPMDKNAKPEDVISGKKFNEPDL